MVWLSRARLSIVFSVLAFVASCDDRAACLASLHARSADWQRDIGRLRATAAELRARFDRAGGAHGAGIEPADVARRVRVESVLESTALSLNDIERLSSQTDDEVTALVERQPADASKALDRFNNRISTALAIMSRQLQQAAVDVNELERAQPGAQRDRQD